MLKEIKDAFLRSQGSLITDALGLTALVVALYVWLSLPGMS